MTYKTNPNIDQPMNQWHRIDRCTSVISHFFLPLIMPQNTRRNASAQYYVPHRVRSQTRSGGAGHKRLHPSCRCAPPAAAAQDAPHSRPPIIMRSRNHIADLDSRVARSGALFPAQVCQHGAWLLGFVTKKTRREAPRRTRGYIDPCFHYPH